MRDYLAYEDASTDDNWRLPGGYGAFIAAQGAALAAWRSTPASARTVTLDADVTLATHRGPIHARAAIVAVSTAVLARGGIRFGHLPSMITCRPPRACRWVLPTRCTWRSGSLRRCPPSRTCWGGSAISAATGSYYLRPFGLPVIECFLGGACARGLEKLGPGCRLRLCHRRTQESARRRVCPHPGTHHRDPLAT